MSGHAWTDPAATPAASTILGALTTLFDEPTFRLSDRNRRFLAFVVRETIDGNSDRIKAYTIGVDVFGRDHSFDPTVDPIVRIEANRIRSALSRYYEGAGQGQKLRIAIPPGAYVPTFAVVPPGHAEPPPISPERIAAAVGVAAPEARKVVVRDRSGLSDPATALRRDMYANAVMRSLGRSGFKVFWSPSESDGAAAKAAGERLAAVRCLDVAVHQLGTRRRYSWRLWDTDTGAVLACDHRDLEAKETPCIDGIDEVAEIATREITAFWADR